ncbi:MAG: CBS domain-containing protein [Polyangiaceae bacterium]
MTSEPVKVSSSAPVTEAAKKMREANVGAILVEDGGQVGGVITDRDIAIRVVAEGRDPANTPISTVYTKDIVTLMVDDEVDRAIDLMRERTVRRMPIRDRSGLVIGIVSLGDLAIERDPQSVLGCISAAPPND